MNYDIIIIGGGIAGLNILYNLYKDKSNKKILLIEKNNYLGGRIKTFRKTINNIKYSFEEGAGRFNNNHKLLINLIKELKMEKYIIPMTSDVSYIPIHNNINKKYINKTSFDFIDKVIKSIEMDVIDAQNYTFKAYCLEKNIISKEDFKFISDSYGYYSELIEMNAVDTAKLIKEGISTNLNFYSLSCGFDKLIEKMINKIKSKLNLTIKLNHSVKKIKYKNNFFTCDNFTCNNCILALPKPNLLKLKILKPINNLLDKIICCPLCKIYAIYSPTGYKKVWFKNINKTTTNNNLRIITPINKKTGSIIISYTDNKYAEFWKNKTNIIPLINKYVKETYNKEIEDPIFIKKSYWNCGVGYWKKNINSKLIYKKIEKPYNNIPLFICGENYSLIQGWIEGALVSSNNVYKKLRV